MNSEAISRGISCQIIPTVAMAARLQILAACHETAKQNITILGTLAQNIANQNSPFLATIGRIHQNCHCAQTKTHDRRKQLALRKHADLDKYNRSHRIVASGKITLSKPLPHPHRPPNRNSLEPSKRRKAKQRASAHSLEPRTRKATHTSASNRPYTLTHTQPVASNHHHCTTLTFTHTTHKPLHCRVSSGAPKETRPESVADTISDLAPILVVRLL